MALSDELSLPVAMSRPPRGRLQLHRLEALHGFTCRRCNRVKRSMLIALVDGDPLRPVCNGCYGALTASNADGEEIAGLTPARTPPQLVLPAPKKKAAPSGEKQETAAPVKPKQKEKQAPAQAKKKQKKKLTKAEKRAKQREEGGAKAAARRASQESKALANANKLFGFFRDAGINGHARNGKVFVNGKEVMALISLYGLRLDTFEDVRDQIAAVACSREFVAAMKRNAGGLGKHLRAYYDRPAHGFELRDGVEPIALIRAGRAHIYGGELVEGNFLIDGTHWSRLEKMLAEEKKRAAAAKLTSAPGPDSASGLSPEPVQKKRVLIDEVPESVGSELAEEVLEASRKIREERRLAFDRSVTLEYELGALTLAPIAGTPERLRVPFTLARDRQRIGGEILLSARSDPLPVRIDEDAGLLLEGVWAAALIGLADATCFELPQPQPHHDAASRSTVGGGHRRGGRSKRSDGYRRLHSSAATGIWPAHLQPIGSWARYSGSFVGGHRRRLRDGWSASPEAIENARRVGIVLAPGETWVKPHARGLPEKVSIRFRWRASEPLLDAYNVQPERRRSKAARGVSSV